MPPSIPVLLAAGPGRPEPFGPLGTATKMYGTGITGAHFGRVAEWTKAHAWRACGQQPCLVGSNPTPSVIYASQIIV